MKTVFTKIRQRFDRDFYKGSGFQFVWVLGIFAFFFLIFCMFCGLGGISVWRMLELLFDPGAFVDSPKKGNVWFQLIVALVGAVIFTSFTINVIGNSLSRRLDAFAKGRVTYGFENHILFLGANGMLVNILKDVLEDRVNEDRDIVIVTERDVEGVREHLMSRLPSSTMKNVYVLYGNRALNSTLESARAVRASSIYLLGEDNEEMHDALNLEAWRHLKELYSGQENVISCYLVLDRLSSEYSFHYKSDSASSGNLRLVVVNAVENIAQRVLVSREYEPGLQYPALDRGGIGTESGVGVHLVVVGMTQTAYAMAVTAAHICHFPNFRTKGIRTRISFVMQDIRQEMDYFKGHYSQLMKMSSSRYIGWKDGNQTIEIFNPDNSLTGKDVNDEKGFLDVEWEFIDGGIESDNVRKYLACCAEADGRSEYLTVAVCEHDPETNVAISLYLPSEIYEKNIPVFVYQKTSGEVLRAAASTDRFGNVYPFGMKSDCYDPQYKERLERAKRISCIYDHTYDYQSMPDTDMLDKSWFDMKYVFQRSNLYAANSIPAKLRSLGIEDASAVSAFDERQVEIMSETEHNRWNVERLLAGFMALPYEVRMYYKTRLDDPAQEAEVMKEHEHMKDTQYLHKDIAPYDELSERSKDYDKAIVRNLLDVMR